MKTSNETTEEGNKVSREITKAGKRVIAAIGENEDE